LTASIVLTAIVIALIPVSRYLRRSAAGANKERRLLFVMAFNVLVVASFYYIVRNTAVGRDWYCVLLMMFVLAYFGGLEGYRVSRARMSHGD